eukprot:11533785-Alexandrium_andersonii.AAC.1
MDTVFALLGRCLGSGLSFALPLLPTAGLSGASWDSGAFPSPGLACGIGLAAAGADSRGTG